MTKEELEKRLAELSQKHEQTVSEANMLFGAIRECETWLAKLKETEWKPPQE
jgi:hypothetical protein